MSEKEKELKNKEWIEWRKAKKEGRLTEHRKMLRSEKYRQQRKKELGDKER